MSENYGIHWFRRDLRVAGNRALKENFKQNSGRVVGVFCFDKKFLSREDFSANRFHLFLKTLSSLRDEMRTIGSDLLFLDEGPSEAFPDLLSRLETTAKLPSLVTWSRDYEPFSRRRDPIMESIFADKGVPTSTARDHLLIEPQELTKNGDSENGYQVYSPFGRKWLKIFESDEVDARVRQQKKGLEYWEALVSGSVEPFFSLQWNDLLPEDSYPDNLKDYIQENEKKLTVTIPDVGPSVVLEALKTFQEKIDQYGDKRDFPNVSGTSRFSMFLKNGSLTVPQIIAFYGLKPYVKKSGGRDIFFSELIWREFYYHILFRYPEVEKKAFLKKFENLQWGNNPDWFEAWKEGRTGFPIVDAGMRELKTTGWMHNRVRMIVASFLTKDLLIDWRWGEQYFMDQLLDGDLAPNNGGWQWAASTGCDPQPFFRIFNPWSQSVKFDKEGVYIRQFLPELASLSDKELHAPIVGHPNYPEPIVDHSEQRKIALALYKQVHEEHKQKG